MSNQVASDILAWTSLLPQHRHCAGIEQGESKLLVCRLLCALVPSCCTFTGMRMQPHLSAPGLMLPLASLARLRKVPHLKLMSITVTPSLPVTSPIWRHLTRLLVAKLYTLTTCARTNTWHSSTCMAEGAMWLNHNSKGTWHAWWRPRCAHS